MRATAGSLIPYIPFLSLISLQHRAYAKYYPKYYSRNTFFLRFFTEENFRKIMNKNNP